MKSLCKAMVARSPEESTNGNRALVKQQGFEQIILPVMFMDPNDAFKVLDQAARIFTYSRQELEDVTDA